MIQPKSYGKAWALTGATAILAFVSQPALAGGCVSDLDGNGEVDTTDLLQLLADWGECPGCPADIDGNGVVETPDLLALLAEFGAECGSFTPIELAGNPLGQYPHFEYVTAFNEGQLISVAVDPTRFPEFTGKTADIYVVEARTTSGWDADNGLVDVRGGAQTFTFPGGTIQANTVPLAGSPSLEGDAFLDLGVPYDVVLDCNQNGVLDAGDYIDGYNAQISGRRPVHGMYVVKDLRQSGPYAVTEITYNVPGWPGTAGRAGQNTFYPSNISSLGELPLIVVSRGNGHNHLWYDHIGFHMASWGYVVMSHNNETEPGIETASTTTLLHTDWFIEQLPNIQGGILDGHVDTSRMTWIGHSRGGEGVTRAYDRLFDGAYVPDNYTLEDIALISSMAPTDFLGSLSAFVHDANYHLWTGQADSDVNGCADCDLCQTFQLHDRAQGFRQATTLHGVGHAWFHNGGGNPWATGPCLIGEDLTHDIQLPYFLAIIKHYVEGNVPAKDYLWRQWESFRAIGSPAEQDCGPRVNYMYREDPALATVIDDFQSNGSTGQSSSGGVVDFNVDSIYEGILNDGNTTFTNTTADPDNGMTVGGPGDDTAGVIFQWTNSNRYYEQGIVAGERDFTDDVYLTFRAAQQTRHPNTLAEDADLTFTVTLRDGSGATSNINIGAYGGGLEQPYERTGCGTGAGWSNEFETIRVRLSDFANNGSGIDLSDIDAIRFNFGPAFGSNAGRIGMDDIMLVKDIFPEVPGALTITPISEIPTLIPPDQTTGLAVEIAGATEEVVPGTAKLWYRFNGGAFQSVDLTGGPTIFSGTLPAAECGDMPEFYFSAEGTASGEIRLPADAPVSVFSADVGELIFGFDDDFETDQGWTVQNLGATSGDWERGVPVDDDSWDYDPASDSDGSGQCYLTENALGNTDVDNGATRMTSPVFNGSNGDITLSYDYYLRLTDADGGDRILVEVDNTGAGGAWTTVAVHDLDNGSEWTNVQLSAQDLIDAGVPPTATMQIRFTVNDADTQSIVEAGVDAVQVFSVQCN